MFSVRRASGGFATQFVFVCPQCGHQVRLASPGSGGFYVAAGFIATGAIAAIMAASKGFSQTEAIITAVLLAAFSAPSILEAISRYRHPVTGERPLSESERSDGAREIETGSDDGPAWLDRFSFATSFLGLFVFVVLWFLFWGAVAFIKDTFL